MNVSIGVLGGMGPRATVEFENRFVQKFNCTDQDIPKMVVINDGSIPDRTNYLLDPSKESPIDHLIQNISALKNIGVDYLCLPCNTAHAKIYFDTIMAKFDIDIIHMPKEVVKYCIKKRYKSVCILGTEGTRYADVYEVIQNNINNDLKMYYPDDTTQNAVTKVINSIKSGNPYSLKDKDIIVDYCKLYRPDAIVLACTELSMFDIELDNIKVIDSLDILVDAAYLKAGQYTNR
jgi:aspartate racemase